MKRLHLYRREQEGPSEVPPQPCSVCERALKRKNDGNQFCPRQYKSTLAAGGVNYSEDLRVEVKVCEGQIRRDRSGPEDPEKGAAGEADPPPRRGPNRASVRRDSGARNQRIIRLHGAAVVPTEGEKGQGMERRGLYG